MKYIALILSGLSAIFILSGFIWGMAETQTFGPTIVQSARGYILNIPLKHYLIPGTALGLAGLIALIACLLAKQDRPRNLVVALIAACFLIPFGWTTWTVVRLVMNNN